MKVHKKWISIALATGLSVALPMTALAGWEHSGTSYRYQKENGSYAVSEWVLDNGIYYYMNQNGIMAANTTTPDGYLVGPDGSWVQEKQAAGGYVRTPYDNQPYRYDAEWQRYLFDEETDYAGDFDHLVLAAVRGIIPATDLTEKSRVVYEELCQFLVGFDYGASDYDKAKWVYEEITRRAEYNHGDYEFTDDEPYGILVLGKGKCVGFASTYKLFANAVGLKCEIRANMSHVWNGVYVDGEAKWIDASTTETPAEFYLDSSTLQCPSCGYQVTFGAREAGKPCWNCGTQIHNPKFD